MEASGYRECYHLLLNVEAVGGLVERAVLLDGQRPGKTGRWKKGMV